MSVFARFACHQQYGEFCKPSRSMIIVIGASHGQGFDVDNRRYRPWPLVPEHCPCSNLILRHAHDDSTGNFSKLFVLFRLGKDA